MRFELVLVEAITRSVPAAGAIAQPSARAKSIRICAIVAKACWADDSTLQRFNASKPMKFIVFLSLPLYALDQLTKQLVLRFINPFDARIVIPDVFTLVHVTNNGAAFGTFKGNNTFFVGISILALVVVTVLLVRSHRGDLWRDISLALLLAGILGNLTDRLLYGHVIDFLLFNLHVRYADPWPAFNVADSCISIAVVLFIIHSFRGQKSAG